MTQTEQKLFLAPERISLEWLSSVVGQKVKVVCIHQPDSPSKWSKLFVSVTYCTMMKRRPVWPEAPTSVQRGLNQALVAQYPDIMIRGFIRER